jgi:hypothetical protein
MCFGVLREWIGFTQTNRLASPIQAKKLHTLPNYLTHLKNLKIAYRTNNSIELNLKPKAQTTNKHLTSGIYKLTCAECGRAYVDQTEISLKGTKNIIAPSKITATPPNSSKT